MFLFVDSVLLGEYLRSADFEEVLGLEVFLYGGGFFLRGYY